MFPAGVSGIKPIVISVEWTKLGERVLGEDDWRGGSLIPGSTVTCNMSPRTPRKNLAIDSDIPEDAVPLPPSLGYSEGVSTPKNVGTAKLSGATTTGGSVGWVDIDSLIFRGAKIG